MTCVQTTATYSHLLGSCVTMLISACAYIITHTVSGSETKRERGAPARETQSEQREEKSVVDEKTRKGEGEGEKKEEGESLASEPRPDRTDCPAGATAVEREFEVEHEQQEEEEGGKLATPRPAKSAVSNNGAAVLRNGDITKSSVSDSEPVTKATVGCILYHLTYRDIGPTLCIYSQLFNVACLKVLAVDKIIEPKEEAR